MIPDPYISIVSGVDMHERPTVPLSAVTFRLSTGTSVVPLQYL